MLKLVVLALVPLTLAALARAADITVDASQKHQTIEGFGTCLVSWVPDMARFYETPEAAKRYAQDMKFNFLRCNLWGDGTIPLTRNPEKISYSDPAFAAKDPRTPVFISFATAIRKLNPEVKVIGTVWSPPAWMKENNSITDKGSGAIMGKAYKNDKGEMTNRVKQEYYLHFTKWLVEMVKYYDAHGVPMYAISPANEPQFTQGFESCVWTPDDLATIIAMLRAQLDKEGLNRIKIFGPESMTGFNWEGGPNRLFVDALKANPAAMKGLDVFATHGYADGFKADISANSSAQFWNLIKDLGKPYWFTEGGTGGHTWPQPIGKNGVGPAIHNAFVAGNASAFVPWQFVEARASEHCLAINSGPTKKTFVTEQYSRYIPAGSTRIDASPAYGDVNASAYLGPDGRAMTIVLINATTSEQPVKLMVQAPAAPVQFQVFRTSATEDLKSLDALKADNGTVQLTMPAQSVVTLTTYR